jgi:hypothetical protein
MSDQPRREYQPSALPLGGLLLVAVGVLLLLQTIGVVPWGLWLELWRFWPVLLVVAGGLILLGGRAPLVATLAALALLIASVGGAYALADRASFPTVTEISLAEPLNNLESAEVHLAFSAGDLRVGALPPGSVDLARGELRTPGREASAVLERRNGEGQLTISSGAAGGLGWLGGGGGAQWDLALSRDVPLALDVDGGAASMELDLRHLRVERLDLDVGAADGERFSRPADSGGELRRSIWGTPPAFTQGPGIEAQYRAPGKS